MLDRIKCRLGIHNWIKKFQKFDLNYILPKGIITIPSYFPYKAEYMVRICTKCHKKQRKSSSFDKNRNLRYKIFFVCLNIDFLKWVDIPLNTDEKRDKIIEDILN